MIVTKHYFGLLSFFEGLLRFRRQRPVWQDL
jgi:hypothetical protein